MANIMAVITPLAAYFFLILTEVRRQRRNYGRKKFYDWPLVTSPYSDSVVKGAMTLTRTQSSGALKSTVRMWQGD